MPTPPPSHRMIDGGPPAAGGKSARRTSDHAFAGFRPIDANFIYTPNQFFDVLLPNHSRGCVRLVAYLLRRTLGWLDADGRPLEQRISVSYQQLIAEAGISRGGIRKALDEALAANYIRCTRRGRSKSAGIDAVSARYELRWDDSGEWAGKPCNFRGFFTGEGRRTPVPDDYFDQVVPREPLAVSRVVGVVLRQTVGYQNQFGGRRREASLSYSDLQRRCNLGDRKTLANALTTAMEVGYIERLTEGNFDPDAGRRSLAACYGPRWLLGSKTPPVQSTSARSKNPTGRSVQNSHRNRFKDPTGNGSIAPPAHKEERQPKDTSKQQSPEVAAAVGVLSGLGFDVAAVRTLLAGATPDLIFRQVAWLPRRKATRSRLGLLRRAILEDWAEPAGEPAGPKVRNSEPADPAYREFLLEREAALRESSSWPAFEKFRAKERRRHEVVPEPRRSELLDAWSSDAKRLRDLQAFFELPDAKTWTRAKSGVPNMPARRV